MKGKINLNNLIMNVLILLPVTTLFQGIIPVINRATIMILILPLLYIAGKNRHCIKEAVALLLFLTVYGLAFFITKGAAENTNEYFYLLFFMLFASYVMLHYNFIREYLQTHTGYIKRVVIFWDAAVIVSLFFKSSYEDGFFFSFTGSVFRSATAATFILALIMILVSKNKKNVLYAIVPMFCIFSGGSRTYLAVGLAIFLTMYYMVAPSRRFFVFSLIPLAILVGLVVWNSSIMYKINRSLTVLDTDFYQDPLIRFTSGRSLFWEADLKAFFNGKLSNQIFGYGYNFVYDVNLRATNARIWAHNDFINILLSYGYIGLASYVCMFIMMFKSCVKQLKCPRWLKWVMVFIWFFNAFFNMFYTYVCASTSYPLILFSLSLFWEKKEKKDAVGWERKSES